MLGGRSRRAAIVPSVLRRAEGGGSAEEQDWYIYPQQTRDEALVFATWCATEQTCAL
jgi:hypothetical protein